MDFLLRGLIVGVSIAAPVGPIGLLCIQQNGDRVDWQIIRGHHYRVRDCGYRELGDHPLGTQTVFLFTGKMASQFSSASPPPSWIGPVINWICLFYVPQFKESLPYPEFIALAPSEIALFLSLIGSLFLSSIIIFGTSPLSRRKITENIFVLLFSSIALGGNWIFLSRSYKDHDC